MKKQQTTTAVDIINERILEQLKNGSNIFVPKTTQVKLGNAIYFLNEPRNYISNTPYTSVNRALLPSGFYMTYTQCKSLGGKVKKGAKSYSVFMAIPSVLVSFKDKTTGKTRTMYKATFEKLPEEEKPDVIEEFTTFRHKYYTVFNIADCENFKVLDWGNSLPKEEPSVPVSSDQLNPLAEFIVMYNTKQRSNPVQLKPNCDIQASCYIPSKDTICIKNFYKYEDANDYYSNVFHELAHSTGHESRLKRKGITDLENGNENTYSLEEVIAETASTYLMQKLGLLTNEQLKKSSEYVQGWYSRLTEDIKKDKNIVIKAFTQADNACRYLTTQEE